MAMERQPLWPEPIPVIGLTGGYGSGKTLFGLTVCPGSQTLVYDLEKSSASYASLGHDRVDVPAAMLAAHPDGNHTPMQLFTWWRDHVRAIEPGRYRVIMVDPASEIEQGLYDFVFAHPEAFGKTRMQYVKSSAMAWGDVKNYWKRILTDVASRCETFVYTVHLKSVWVDNKPTGKRTPKGLATLEELASLSLWMERAPNARGETPAKPAARVVKSRLYHHDVDGQGDIRIVPALPPRLPVATPAAIREYQRTPPDYSRLTPEEMAPEVVMSEDDRLEMRARIAEAEAETERLRMERTAALAGGRPTPAPVRPTPLPPTLAATKAAPAPALPPPSRPVDDPAPACGMARLARLGELREAFFGRVRPDDPDGVWRDILARRGVTTARDLTPGQTDALIAALAHQCSTYDLEERHAATQEADAVGDLGFPAVID